MPISKLKASSIASGTIDNARISLDAAEIPALPTSKITSGTFDDARIAASNVSQHATSFDDNKLVNDLSTLGLRVHTQENLSASNTNSQYVDVFQDATGFTNGANCERNASEYVASVSTTTFNPTVSGISVAGGANNSPVFSINNSTGLITHDTSSTTRDYDDNDIFGCRLDLGEAITITSDFYLQVTGALIDGSNHNFGVVELNASTSAGSGYQFGSSGTITSPSVYFNANGGSWDVLTDDNDAHFYDTSFDYHGKYANGANLPAIIRYRWSGNGGVISARYIDVGFANTWAKIQTFNLLHNSTSSSTSPGGTNLGITRSTSTASATGNFTCPNITAASATTKMGAVITYQDNEGTNALNTDIVLQLSADGGSNYSTATLTALPDFSTGIKMAKVNDLTVTSGTQLKYKILFANQAAGSKEARIRGVSLNY